MNQRLKSDPYISSSHNCTDLNDVAYAIEEIGRITGGNMTKYAKHRLDALKNKRRRLLDKVGLV